MTPENDKGAQPEPAPSPVQRETDEGQPILNPAEITLPEEDGQEPTITEQEEGEQPEGQQQAEPQQQPRRGKNRVPAKQRINQLWHEKTQAETRAEQLERENAELKRQMEEGTTQRKQVDTAALVAHERAVTAERDLAKRKLIDAKAAGNAELEVEATGALSRAEAELGNIAAWKAANPPPAAKPNGQAQPDKPEQGDGRRPNGQQPQQVEVSPEIQEWVQNNLWAVNDPRNTEFDPEMAEYMAAQAKSLERRMRAEGRPQEIGTRTYFDELDGIMREEFPDRFDDTEEEDVPQPQPRPQPRQQPANQRRAPQMQRQNGTPIAPAAQSAGQQVPAAQKRTVNLSAEERSFAHGMAANGALKYPAGHKMQGKPMSPADAEVAYARQKLSQNGGR